MSAGCKTDAAELGATRRVLLAVLAINAVMFAVEGLSGWFSGSLALQADALDFLGDSLTYGISLYVIGRSLAWRSGAATLKGAAMGFFGVWILAAAIARAFAGPTPEAAVMGVVGFLALGANLAAALLLYRFRSGDANLRSVWLCSRNDALGNVAVMLAAAGVFGSASRWPDLAVALLLASLAISAAWQILRQARDERRAVVAAE
jgi:Co/Zn/Cd efflux system component